jgi:DeoR family fructose operon transcriptional repressor
MDPHPLQTLNLLTSVQEMRATLSPKMRMVADFALNNPEEFIRHNSKDLCAVLGTSEPTLIRFCKFFDLSGVAEFRINLALSLVAKHRESGKIEPRADDRRLLNRPQKTAIAKAAIELIANDSALLLDNGSTAEMFAQELADLPPKTIMTSGLVVAQTAASHGQHNVIVTGGTVRPASMCMTGRLVNEAMRGMHFDTFIMGADSVSLDRGISTFLEDEAENTRILMSAAERTIVLVDRSKFDKPSLHRICDAKQVDTIVTNLPENSDVVHRFADKGINLTLVSDEM